MRQANRHNLHQTMRVWVSVQELKLDPASPTPLRIAIVHNEFSMSGGGHRQALALARELQLKGHHVRCIAAHVDPKQCYPELLAQLNWVDFHSRSNGPPDKTPPTTAAADLKAMPQAEKCWRLAELVAQEPTDIVNLHDYLVLEVAAFLPSTLPVVWMLNDLRHIERLRRARRPLRKKLISLFRWISPRLKSAYLRSRAVNQVGQIVVLDSPNKERVKTAFDREATIIRSGCEIPSQTGERTAPQPGATIRLMSVGILFPTRRYEDLIRAVHHLRESGLDVVATIIGRSDWSKAYAEQLRDLTVQLNLGEAIRFIEYLTDAEIDEHYRTAHAFVFPHAPQTWGLSPFEAIVRGTPAVLTTGCGASEVVKNEVTAMVTSPHQPEALAAAIRRLVTESELWQGISRRGMVFVRENITWARYAEQMEQVFVAELKQR